MATASQQNHERQMSIEEIEDQEWIDSLEDVLERSGSDRTRKLLEMLRFYAQGRGVELPFNANTPMINTIPADKQAAFPGNREVERRIKSLVRWNAMAMVVRANKHHKGLGGHISTYASAATLLEVGFNHFFRAHTEKDSGDQIYFQGHASPGIYARAFLEGRLSEDQLSNFRRELQPGGGLSSYPHPWLMPEFWQYPTVSMGLGPIMAIYQARFNRYLEDRGLCDTSRSRVWCYMGDGETDEPESLGAITLASREQLDNLIFVINCNLQRLDGPVRGNGNIIQELEAAFRGAGWRVIKVLWGKDWDPLLAQDHKGLLVKRMGEVVNGQLQKYTVESGDYIRKDFFGKYPELLEMVKNMNDEQLEKLTRGGHDPEKVYAAYKEAEEQVGKPTVILAHTIKGYGLGEAGEGRNVTHNQKSLNEEELIAFRARFAIPISDKDVAEAPFYRPPEDSPEMQYLHERRKALGGYKPSGLKKQTPLDVPERDYFADFLKGSGDRDASTTMAYGQMLSKLLKHKAIGKHIVPIIPDEARTFGMEALFRQCGIYAHAGQLYEPVDAELLLYYKEAEDGQILEEGINEAGAMSSFIAAGTAYSSHGVSMIPFFTYYSMFGFQRIGDLVWAAGDLRCKGFMVGGTSGRTTLNGEGLQHQDGHSHILFDVVPNVVAYDPAFAYEIAIIIQDGIKRMYADCEDVFYYLTVHNENYRQPQMPEGAEEGILKGLYKFRASSKKGKKLRAQLLGSGAILNEVIKAQEILEKDHGVTADVWSATSYKELRREAMDCERWNMLHPDEEPRVPYVTSALEGGGVTVASSDYIKAWPGLIEHYVPGRFVTLGTDGYGRSETREALRDHFEVDHRYVIVATLYALAKEGKLEVADVKKAIEKYGIDTERPNPLTV